MAELEAAGGDFTRLSNTVAERDGALPVERLLADLRSDALHGWQPPGGGAEGALPTASFTPSTSSKSCRSDHRVPDDRILRVLSLVADPGRPNLFGTDLSGVELRADDLEWSCGSGAPVVGPAQALASVACGRLLPAGTPPRGGAERFTR